MPRRAKELPPEVLAALAGADLVIHLGDFTELSLVHVLESFAPLAAVHGNNDSEEIRARFPATLRLRVEGHVLVLVHGDRGARSALLAARAVEGGDAVLFGHSHRPWCTREDGRLLFNPGSPTDRRWFPHRCFGTLDIGAEILPRLVHLP
jgi:putative phosphoesterase